MNRTIVQALLLGTAFVVLATQGPPTQAQSQAPEDVPGELLIQFTRQAPQSRRLAIMAAEGGQDLQRFDQFEIHHVRLAPGRNVRNAVAAIARNPEVLAVQPNYTREIVQAQAPPPNDPLWLDGTLWGLVKIQAQPVWTTFGSGNGTVVIADIDTGVNYNHVDLNANMWRNPGEIAGNSIDDDLNGYVDDVFGIDTVNGDTNPNDDNGHGTHTAGTIAGVGNNGTGVAGVNWNAKILACKFLNASGNGSDAGAIACFNYIVALKNRGINIRVSSNSWGSLRGGGPPASALKNAIDAAGAAGIVNIFAAGNNGVNIDSTPFDPAAFTSSSIVSVAASDQNDNRAGFSNYGVIAVDLAAPGVSIASTYGSGYAFLQGTSMAAPHVAGAAALLSSFDPGLSVDSLKFVLMNQVDALTQWSTLVASGGRMNLLKAANAVGTPPPSGRVNVALASNGGTATASSTHSPGYAASGANNGDRRGQPWGSGGGWNDGTANAWPDSIEIAFNGTKTIDEVGVFSVQDNYASPLDPTASMTFSLYGLRDFEVQYWNGAWVQIPGAVVTGNSLVWRKFTFAAVSTTKIRVWVTSALNTWTRVTEVEAYTQAGANTPPTVSITAPSAGAQFTAPASINLTADAADPGGSVTSVAFFANGAPIGTDSTSPYGVTWPGVAAGAYSLTAVATDNQGAQTTSAAVGITVNPPAPGRVNVALAANGGTAAASSTHSAGYLPSGAINGDRRGQPWGGGGGWNDGTANTWADWIEITFNGSKTIDEVDVFSVQDNYIAPLDPTLSMTFSLYGLRDFEIQYLNGATWVTIPGATVAGNSLVWRQFIFAPVTTTGIRVWVTSALSSWTRVTEVEAYTSSGPANTPPTVSLTAPANGSQYTAPAMVNLAANAADPGGSVASVGFFANGAPIGSDTTSPYEFPWSNVVAGTYVLTAVATDNLGASTTSAPVSITVNPAAGRVNVALAANGGTAAASSTHSTGYDASGANNGDRRGQPWGAGGGWNDGTANAWPDWIEITFNGLKTIDEVDVFSVQDNYLSPLDPTPSMTFSLYGLRNFEIQYLNGATWVAIPGAAVTNNSLVWRQFSFSPITTTKIRVWVTGALDTWTRVTEVEVYTPGSAPAPEPVADFGALAMLRYPPPVEEPARVRAEP